MRTLEGKRVVRKIVNLTSKAFCVYEESSGIILTLIPSTEKLPYVPDYNINKLPSTYYVVERKDVKKISKYRTLTDIVVIENESAGRDEIMISTLVLANRPRIRVGIQRECYYPMPTTEMLAAIEPFDSKTLNAKEERQRFNFWHYAEVH